ncbi:PucR family transcriptional regulator [Geodermatophilus sp. SYSU D00697]
MPAWAAVSGPGETGPDAVDRVAREVAEASAGEHGMPVALLDGYLTALWTVARTGRRLSVEEERACRRLGGEAAAAGLALPSVVDLYMTASRRLWPRLPDLMAGVRGRPLRPAELVGLGEAVWRAADTALAALAAGYVEAQREVVRREEAFRREFVDDLLSGHPDVGSLVQRAEPFGLTLTAAHVVTVAATDRPIDSGMQVAGSLAEDVRARFGERGFLAVAKDGRLVCVLSQPPATVGGDAVPGVEELAELAGRAAARLTRRSHWRVGIGRPHPGAGGVRHSYREALEAMDLAERLGLPQRVVHVRDLLVYRVLVRDEAAMADLVHAVLGPLMAARGGAAPLLDTLEAWFASGGNTSETARRLHLSVRAVTYRLQRVQELTGHDAGNPEHRLTLHVAVTGARLLDWPRRPLHGD